MVEVKLQLRNGNVIVAKCPDDEYDSIYAAWTENRIMAFDNCVVKGLDVMAIQYGEDEGEKR